MRVPVFDAQGKRTQEILEFDETIFGKEVRRKVLKDAVLMYEARQRQGTHSTKTRKEVSGSGKKLWRQKGTGRARVGPARAPHWRGGGTVFGPKPRSYAYSMPKKARKIAMNSAWLAKLQDKEIKIIEKFGLDETPKSAIVNNAMKELGVLPMRTIIGIAEYDQVLWKSARNIPAISVQNVMHFNPYLLLHNKWVILQRKAFEELIKARGGEIKALNRKELYS